MLKFLRSVALAVVMLLPFASNAQTLTVADGTETNGYVPVYGFYADAYLRCQFVYSAEDLADMAGSSISSMTFYASQASVSWGNANFSVSLKEVANTTISAFDESEGTVVYTGSLSIADNMMTVEFAEPFIYEGGNLLVEVDNLVTGSYVTCSWYGVTANGSSVQGYSYSSFSAISASQRNFLPKVTFAYEPNNVTCYKPYDLDSSDVTYDGFVLSWSDTNAEGTTFTLNEMVNGEEVLVATGIEGTSYTFTGLAANSQHTYKLYANCDVEDQSYAATFTIKTPCGPMSLPYTEDFEGIAQNGAWPDCWNLILAHGTDPSANYVYNHTTGGQYAMYIYTGSNDSNMFATDAVPLAGNNIYVKFWARIANSAYYNPWIQAGVMTDLNDPSTFIPLVTVNNKNGQWQQVEFTTAGLDEDATYYVAWIGYTAGSNNNSYTSAIDDIYINEIPDCLHVTGLTGTSTSNSITLEWGANANEEAVFNVYKAVSVTVEGDEGPTTTTQYVPVATAVDTNTYTIEDLVADTNYALGVSVLCGDFETDTVFLTVRTLSAANAFTAFNATGTMVRGDIVLDAEAHSAVVPVWYATNLNNLTLSWTISAGAAIAIDTAGDGSYTCIVTASTLKNYLRVNVPMTVRLYAEDRAIYTDYTLLLQGEECVADRNLTFTTERIRFTAMWENPDTLVTVHNIICSPVELDAEALTTAEYITVEDTMAYTFEGLERNTQYYVYVKSACATEWVSGTVTTLPLGYDVTCVIADGTTTNYYVPIYGLWFDDPIGTQSVYPASMLSEMVGKTMTSIHYYTTSNNPNWGTNKSLKMSMAIVDVENLSGGYQDISNATVVYDGTISGSDVTNGGLTIVFDQPFTYNGGNLLIAIQGNNEDMGGYGSVYFYGVSATSASRYGYNMSNYNFTAAGSTQNFLPKFSFEYSLPAEACPEVTEVSVDSVSYNFAAISWTAADADYCVGNQIIVSTEMIEDFEGVTPVELAADAITYEAAGLVADQDYYVYIKTLCNGEAHDEGTSGWATATFHTYPTCRVADQLNAVVTGKHTATISWVNNGEYFGQADNFDVLVSNVLYNAEEMLTANPSFTGVAATSFNLTNLMSDTTYYFYVRNVDEELGCTAAWSEPFAFHTVSAMPAVSPLYVSNITHNAMTALWMRNTLEFADETAWRAAITLHGVAPVESDWRIVTTMVEGGLYALGYTYFTELTPETAYDIYVAPYDSESGMIGDMAQLDSIVTAAFPPACLTTEAETYATTDYMPIYGLWADEDQVNQMIYPATMLEDIAGKSITSMHYYVYSGSNENWADATVTVKIAEVEADALNGALMSGVEQTTVFTGTVTANEEDGMTITFDAPYVYNGGNLLVEFDLQTTGTWGSVSFIAIESAGASVCSYNGMVNNVGYLPVADFCYIRENTCLDVNTIYANDVTSNSANLFWYPGNEETAWEYYLTNDTENLTVETLEANAIAINSHEVALTGLERDTTYYFIVRAVCSDEEHSDWTYRTFHTEFELYDVTVTVAAENGDVEGAGNYTENDEVTLTATPEEGYYFVAWMDGEDTVSTENPYTFTVTEDVNISALFAIYTYTFSATVNDEEMGSVEGMPETETVDYGTEVTLTAIANEGYRFVNWSNEETEETITVVVTSDTALVANFEAIPMYTVTVVATEGGSVTNAGENQVYEGAEFTATATANEGYHFVGWSNGETSATVTITVTADITLTATFAADPQPVSYTITVNYDETMGNVSGAGIYLEGETVTLTATPKDGYEFRGWSNGETAATISFPATQDLTLTATFGLIGINDVDMSNVSIYSVDSKIVVRGAEGNSVYVFDVNGRILNRVNTASDMVEFRMEQTGVYLVKVGNAAAKRVVVVR